MTQKKFSILSASLTLSIAASSLLSLLSMNAHAARIEGVEFPEQLKVESKNLVLNGVGLRSATLFNVKVYAGALYVETKSKNEAEIIDSPQIKDVKMVFLRDVKKDQLNEAWEKGIHKACVKGCPQLEEPLAQLKAMMVSVKPKDTMEFTIFPAKVEVKVNDQKAGEISNANFSKMLLATWIGREPPTEELKAGLLGKK
ncbi:MAG: chalcone isomerase family protein [Methylotenera sp.]|nr:chalcone isomerase family protein [Oligoflexia bacterium]